MIKNHRFLEILLFALPVFVKAMDSDEYAKYKNDLFQGAYSNDYQLIKNALDYKVDVNTICPDMFPAIHAAAQFSDQECLNLLISAKADLSILDAGGRTCLHWAIDSKHDDAIKILVDAKVDPYVQSLFHRTALGLAITQRANSKVKKLIYLGYKFSNFELGIEWLSPKYNILTESLIFNCTDIENLFSTATDEKVNYTDGFGGNALLYACARGNERMVQKLLEYSNSGCLEFVSNSKDNTDNPLALAREYNRENVVKLLMQYATDYAQRITNSTQLNIAVTKLITEYVLGDGYFYFK